MLFAPILHSWARSGVKTGHSSLSQSEKPKTRPRPTSLLSNKPSTTQRKGRGLRGKRGGWDKGIWGHQLLCGPAGISWSGICRRRAALIPNSRWVSYSCMQKECSTVQEIVPYFSNPSAGRNLDCLLGRTQLSKHWVSLG